MSARKITLYDGSTPVEIRIATTAGDDVQLQAEQLRDDLNAFVATADPFSVVSSDSTSGDHIRVELESGWTPGDPDWKLFSSAAGILYVRARSVEWLTRAVACVSWNLGKRMWLPNSAFLVQPTYSTISVKLNIKKTHDVQDTGAFGNSGHFQVDPLETNFTEWRRVNMVDPVPSVASRHMWGAAIGDLGPGSKENPGLGIWNSTDHYVETGNLLQVYREDPLGTYIVCEDFAEWLKGQITDPDMPKDSVSVSASDWPHWESVIGFGRDDGDPHTYNETEINLFLAKKVAENFAADPNPDIQNAQISMLAYGSTSYPADPTKRDPEGDFICLPAGLHVVVTKGFFQGNETWDSVHDSYRELSDNPSDPSHQFSGYWYMDVWIDNKDRPGVAPISREDVLADWWANDAPRVTHNYPLYVGGELGSGLCPTFLGALIWQGAWRERTSDLASLASDVVRNFLQTCFPTSAVRSAMGSFTARVLWIRSGSFAPVLTEDLLHRMYDDLLTAIDASPTTEERARLNAFVKYTRFLELYRAVLAAEVETEAGLDVYDEFRAFLYNIRYEGLVNYAFWTTQDPFGADTDLANQYGLERAGALWGISLENNPQNVPSTWESGDYFPDFTNDGLRTMCVDGMANNDLYPFTIIEYPDPFDGLVEPNPTCSASPVLNRLPAPSWYDRSDAVTMWVMTKPGQTSLDWWFRPWVSAASGSDQTIEVIDAMGTVVASRTFTASEAELGWINWVATGLQEGTVYQLRVNDPHKDGVQISWWFDGDPNDPNGSPGDRSGTYLVSFRVLPAETKGTVLTGSLEWFFYVPADACELGGVWSKKEGKIRDATETMILEKLNSTLEPFHHVLTADQKDTIMRGVDAGDDLALMTVPPYLALHPQELIVPPSAI